MLKYICDAKGVTFINAYPHFLVNGKLNQKLNSGDGLHLSGEGYYLLSSIIQPYLK
jgi:lysophospholipase L1-like esterase